MEKEKLPHSYSKEKILDLQHWTSANYTQRITTKEFKLMLLNDDDQVIFKGRVTKLIGKRIFPGVIEISKEKTE